MEACMKCGAPLSADEIGLHRKLVNRGSTTFCCIHCLSREFKVSEEELRELIERYRRAGCSMFQ